MKVATTRTRVGVIFAACGWIVVFCPGCPPAPARVPLAPVPYREAAAIYNSNIYAVPGALRAVGSADGVVLDADGKRVSFGLDAVLIYLPSDHLYVDMKSLAGTEMIIGANPREYWFFSKRDDDACYIGCFDEATDDTDIPVPPRQIIEALGMTPLPLGHASAAGESVMQRVVEEYQQILFVEAGSGGRALLIKEYWLDRLSPRLVRRVQFRDAEGVVVMQSRLDDYRKLADTNVWLPHRMNAEWPDKGSTMKLTIRRWNLVPQITGDSPQFVPLHRRDYPCARVEGTGCE